MDERDAVELAEAVRAACVAAAERAYEDGGVRGLCAEGRWELAVDAMRDLDLQALLAR
jgi:hypothetical protein